jgi:phosphoenolpyruvate synthase/pyruvate phosphate dikinase
VGPFEGAEVAAAYQELGMGPVAVRSSGLTEDSASASFAGQHDTLLNVVGVDDLLVALRSCALSGSSEHARAYRSRAGLAEEALMPVLVQRLVIADCAGVCFSVSPSSSEHLLINAAWGLGESIVSSEVTPDSYAVARATFSVESSVSDKTVMTVAVPGGVLTVPVPRFLRRRPCLRERDLLLVAELALELEREHARPVDMEFCFGGGSLYLLQCRPITT